MNNDKKFLEILKKVNAKLSVWLEINEPLNEIRQALRDCNSKLPATQEFLKNKGLTHIDQLDQKGMEELVDHLTVTLNVEQLKQNLNIKNPQT